ncbi:MFS transporter [Rhodocytophaga rosea]|uniref:MFS transporter n=1 Tax=Rhodocytophaga rosea TaxID=2704465 RepID=A0A6C0GR41_9BACT|nr:MFS transporter [Rhodocytophaga rosea]QHT70334.1 MFS transporter [Rhodocytophaga rosea]
MQLENPTKIQPVHTAIGNYRWRICALLFFATTINYIDRQVLGLLKPTLEQELGWTEIQYSNIVVAFQAAYAIGFLFMGWIMDKFGTKKGFSFALIFWSITAMAHALAKSATGFGIARFGLGLGEAGNFPACIKTIAEWFPKKERSFATGIFNAGTNVGAILAPPIVAWLTLSLSWRWAFIATGAIGFLWLIVWWVMYDRPEKHSQLSKAELDYIRSDAEEPVVKTPWIKLIPHRQTWAFALGKFMTDPIWWIYLFWLPDFLNKNYGLDLKGVALPIIIIYLVSDVGSVAGGWFSSFLMKKGWDANRARKTTMLICAISVVPMVFASQVTSLWAIVALISLATSAHQGWSANLYTLTSDMFPRHAVGSVVGIGGMLGAVGGMFIAKIVGFILEYTGSYMIIFTIAGTGYLFALLVIHLLVPKLEKAKLEGV